jgi:ribosomal protein S18 acetylase RimI-like enzyme
MEIKRVNIEEADCITNLFDLYRQFYKQPSDQQVAQKFIRDRLSNNESVIFVALENQLPVGFTQLYPKYSSMRVNKNWILNDLYVISEYRSAGVGRALIGAAMEFAENEGATFVQLETAVDNYTTQRLYEEIGFKKQEAETEFLLYRIGVKKTI